MGFLMDLFEIGLSGSMNIDTSGRKFLVKVQIGWETSVISVVGEWIA